MNRIRKYQHFSGFTLIEMLIVIAVIALLAAIVFPVFGRARESARRASCQSNLRQIGLGIQQYTQDYDEKMPLHRFEGLTGYSQNNEELKHFMDNTNAAWVPNTLYGIQPYVKSIQILYCPSAPRVKDMSDLDAPDAKSDTSYAYNAVFIRQADSGDDYWMRCLSEITRPAEIVVFQEWNQREKMLHHAPFLEGANNNYSPGSWKTTAASAHHFEGGNLLFCDGHVKWKKKSEITYRMFGFKDATLNTIDFDVASSGSTATPTPTPDPTATPVPTATPTPVPTSPPVNQPPVIDSASVSPSPPFTLSTPFTVTVTAHDPDGTIASIRLVAKKNATENGKGTASSSPATFSGVTVGQANYSVIVRVTDNSGAVTEQTLFTT